jgi:hypothetical protein
LTLEIIVRIIVKTDGNLTDYFGREPQVIELPDDVVVRNLVDFIGQRWGEKLPLYIWDPQQAL